MKPNPRRKKQASTPRSQVEEPAPAQNGAVEPEAPARPRTAATDLLGDRLGSEPGTGGISNRKHAKTSKAPSNIEIITPSATPQDRVAVRLPGVNRPLVAFVSELMTALARTRRVFTRGGKVVEIVADPSDGAERLQLVRPTYAQTMFERYASLRDVDRRGQEVERPIGAELTRA